MSFHRVETSHRADYILSPFFFLSSIFAETTDIRFHIDTITYGNHMILFDTDLRNKKIPDIFRNGNHLRPFRNQAISEPPSPLFMIIAFAVNRRYDRNSYEAR